MKRLSLTKQFNVSLYSIVALTLIAILIANQAAIQLHKAYEVSTSSFIPLMQSANELQSTSANLKSELVNILSEVDEKTQLPAVTEVNMLWQDIQKIIIDLSISSLLSQQDAHLKLLEKQSLITNYIDHTQQLNFILMKRSNLKIQREEMVPRILHLLRMTETELLSELEAIRIHLEESISKNDNKQNKLQLLKQIQQYFRFYKFATLLAEKIIKSKNATTIKELNQLKHDVYGLGNKLQGLMEASPNKRSQTVSKAWLEKAHRLYKGPESIFVIRNQQIRINTVANSLVEQQINTARQLSTNAKNIHVIIESAFTKEALQEKKKVQLKQYFLWVIAVIVLLLCFLITWVFMQQRVVKRLVDIRKIMLLLANGKASIKISRKYRDEIGDMEHALTGLQRYVRQVQQQAQTDALTNLNNRRAFDKALDKELKRSKRNNHSITLLVMDIDHFKQFNDFYGHPEGDAALQDVADLLLKSCPRNNDFIARVGGEEFAIILPNTNKVGAELIAKRILNQISEFKREHKTSLVSDYLTLSIGGKTLSCGNSYQAKELYELADKALYKAKEKRNSAVLE